jgi:RimJ/RimL family protein N-acetyltransferase
VSDATGAPPVAVAGPVIRPIGPEDRAALVRFHHSLSSSTTYLRFFAVHPELSERELDRFTTVDHHDREALVAIVDGELVGVGRYDRLPSSTTAEVGFVVADRWQEHGIGTALLRALEERARAEGVTSLVAHVLPGNSRMLALMSAAGQDPQVRWEDGVARSTIEL